MSDDITLNSTVLVVDDSTFILKFIKEMLKDKYRVLLAESVDTALVILMKHIPELIVLDVEMPGATGYELMAKIKATDKWKNIPVIFLTGINGRESEEKALTMGAVDYITKPITAGVLTRRIQMHLELAMYQKSLESLVDVKTQQLLTTQELILDILANVTTYRDNDTGAHIIRTTKYTQLIVERLLEVKDPNYTISESYASDIINSAKLHDIGKIAIPDGILLKTSRLNKYEYELIKMHTTYGAKMIEASIKRLDSAADFLIAAKEIILCHHEWWNGKGYPNNLKGTEIPLSARIMAISDVYDALISKRPYKAAMSHEAAVDILHEEAGSHFDERLLSIVEPVLPKFKLIAKTFLDD